MKNTLRIGLLFILHAGCASPDPCAGMPGECFVVEVRSDGDSLAAVQVLLHGATEYQLGPLTPPSLPFKIPMLANPRDNGPLQVDGFGNLSAGGIATDTWSGTLNNGVLGDSQHAPIVPPRISLILHPSSGSVCQDLVRDGDESDVDCGGSCRKKCEVGDRCRVPSDCASKSCVESRCRTSTCTDGVLDGDESDVDCGGSCPFPCTEGKRCARPEDCESNVCDMSGMGVCAAPTCTDGQRNQDETDVDCGGSCAPCDDRKVCKRGADCKSLVCLDQVDHRCAPPSCHDGVKNGGEIDVDCGGPLPCPRCADNQACAAPSDCASGVCTSDHCTTPTCMDNVKNGSETDVDCGGDCPACVVNKGCHIRKDCTSGVCSLGGVCLAPTCGDGVKNQTETDIDCGGMLCSPCVEGMACQGAADCLSRVCPAMTMRCAMPACDDMVKNGSETDVDCGGPCPRCADQASCGVPADCVSGVCAMKKCAAPTCTDAVQNGDESDVDCGGSCPKCVDLKRCMIARDCRGGVCLKGQCAVPVCYDGVKNGAESDIDCGGTCPPCSAGRPCLADADCQTAICYMNQCAQPSCTDGRKDGKETDIDCGGGCPGCALGRACAQNADCGSGLCTKGACAPIFPALLACGLPPKPVALAVADFNGDMIDDVAVGFNVPGVPPAVLLGRGLNNASFLAPMLTGGAATSPYQLAAADFNGDVKADLALCDNNGAQVIVSFGTGNGTFQGGASFSTGGGLCTGVAAADFTGDGRPDLVTANNYANTASFLPNNGTGAFAQSSQIVTGATAWAVATADFNRDGNADFYVVDNGDDLLNVFLGTGKGTFSRANIVPRLPFGQIAYAAGAGDVNGDGYADIIVGTGGSAVIVPGLGNGTFLQPAPYPMGSLLYGLAVRDFNNDGRADVAAAGYNSNDVSVRLADNAGGLLGAVAYPTGTAPRSVATGNWNGDLKPDLITANYGGQSLSVLINGGGGFQAAPDLIAFRAPRSVAAIDLNNDGRPELIVANQGASTISVLPNLSIPGKPLALAFPIGVPVASAPFAITAGDWNGDGRKDLAVAGSAVTILYGNGDLSLQSAATYTLPGPAQDIQAADFDRDLKTDFITANTTVNSVSVILGSGVRNTLGPVTQPYAIGVGDFTSDGRLDLVTANFGDNNVTVFAGNGNGTFQMPAPVPGVLIGSPTGLVAADLNGDMLVDIAVSSRGDQRVVVLINGGNNTLQLLGSYPLGGAADAIRADDVNGDKKTDLIVLSQGGNAVKVLIGDGAGKFGPPVSYATGPAPVSIGSGDLDSDGKVDLITGAGNDLVDVLLNTR